MGAGRIVISALKTVGTWVMNNPNIAFEAVDKVAKLPLNAIKSSSYIETSRSPILVVL